jgi:hypothetical protein
MSQSLAASPAAPTPNWRFIYHESRASARPVLTFSTVEPAHSGLIERLEDLAAGRIPAGRRVRDQCFAAPIGDRLVLAGKVAPGSPTILVAIRKSTEDTMSANTKRNLNNIDRRDFIGGSDAAGPFSHWPLATSGRLPVRGASGCVRCRPRQRRRRPVKVARTSHARGTCVTISDQPK